ncbi:unnamed protein product [Amoebophrya sp. A25]|nr:unnamed protein product [Amoebophrya sp. A25]|eukprot:GSA25T00027203001.1
MPEQIGFSQASSSLRRGVLGGSPGHLGLGSTSDAGFSSDNCGLNLDKPATAWIYDNDSVGDFMSPRSLHDVKIDHLDHVPSVDVVVPASEGNDDSILVKNDKNNTTTRTSTCTKTGTSNASIHTSIHTIDHTSILGSDCNAEQIQSVIPPEPLPESIEVVPSISIVPSIFRPSTSIPAISTAKETSPTVAKKKKKKRKDSAEKADSGVATGADDTDREMRRAYYFCRDRLLEHSGYDIYLSRDGSQNEMSSDCARTMSASASEMRHGDAVWRKQLSRLAQRAQLSSTEYDAATQESSTQQHSCHLSRTSSASASHDKTNFIHGDHLQHDESGGSTHSGGTRRRITGSCEFGGSSCSTSLPSPPSASVGAEGASCGNKKKNAFSVAKNSLVLDETASKNNETTTMLIHRRASIENPTSIKATSVEQPTPYPQRICDRIDEEPRIGTTCSTTELTHPPRDNHHTIIPSSSSSGGFRSYRSAVIPPAPGYLSCRSETDGDDWKRRRRRKIGARSGYCADNDISRLHSTQRRRPSDDALGKNTWMEKRRQREEGQRELLEHPDDEGGAEGLRLSSGHAPEDCHTKMKHRDLRAGVVADWTTSSLTAPCLPPAASDDTANPENLEETTPLLDEAPTRGMPPPPVFSSDGGFMSTGCASGGETTCETAWNSALSSAESKPGLYWQAGVSSRKFAPSSSSEASISDGQLSGGTHETGSSRGSQKGTRGLVPRLSAAPVPGLSHSPMLSHRFKLPSRRKRQKVAGVDTSTGTVFPGAQEQHGDHAETTIIDDERAFTGSKMLPLECSTSLVSHSAVSGKKRSLTVTRSQEAAASLERLNLVPHAALTRTKNLKNFSKATSSGSGKINSTTRKSSTTTRTSRRLLRPLDDGDAHEQEDSGAEADVEDLKGTKTVCASWRSFSRTQKTVVISVVALAICVFTAVAVLAIRSFAPIFMRGSPGSHITPLSSSSLQAQGQLVPGPVTGEGPLTPTSATSGLQHQNPNITSTPGATSGVLSSTGGSATTRVSVLQDQHLALGSGRPTASAATSAALLPTMLTINYASTSTRAKSTLTLNELTPFRNFKIHLETHICAVPEVCRAWRDEALTSHPSVFQVERFRSEKGDSQVVDLEQLRKLDLQVKPAGIQHRFFDVGRRFETPRFNLRNSEHFTDDHEGPNSWYRNADIMFRATVRFLKANKHALMKQLETTRRGDSGGEQKSSKKKGASSRQMLTGGGSGGRQHEGSSIVDEGGALAPSPPGRGALRISSTTATSFLQPAPTATSSSSQAIVVPQDESSGSSSLAVVQEPTPPLRSYKRVLLAGCIPVRFDKDGRIMIAFIKAKHSHAPELPKGKVQDSVIKKLLHAENLHFDDFALDLPKHVEAPSDSEHVLKQPEGRSTLEAGKQQEGAAAVVAQISSTETAVPADENQPAVAVAADEARQQGNKNAFLGFSTAALSEEQLVKQSSEQASSSRDKRYLSTSQPTTDESASAEQVEEEMGVGGGVGIGASNYGTGTPEDPRQLGSTSNAGPDSPTAHQSAMRTYRDLQWLLGEAQRELAEETGLRYDQVFDYTIPRPAPETVIELQDEKQYYGNIVGGPGRDDIDHATLVDTLVDSVPSSTEQGEQRLRVEDQETASSSNRQQQSGPRRIMSSPEVLVSPTAATLVPAAFQSPASASKIEPIVKRSIFFAIEVIADHKENWSNTDLGNGFYRDLKATLENPRELGGVFRMEKQLQDAEKAGDVDPAALQQLRNAIGDEWRKIGHLYRREIGWIDLDKLPELLTDLADLGATSATGRRERSVHNSSPRNVLAIIQLLPWLRRRFGQRNQSSAVWQETPRLEERLKAVYAKLVELDDVEKRRTSTLAE